jgi:hypothetical protein
VRHGSTPTELECWQKDIAQTLELLGEWAGGLDKLAVENLEGYPPDFVDPVVDRIGVGQCVDLGHFGGLKDASTGGSLRLGQVSDC